MIVADANNTFELTGNGDVVEPDNGVIAIGSGGMFALSAATALMDIPSLTAEDIVKRSMKIAGDICVYTNHNLTIETLGPQQPPVEIDAAKKEQ
jgi:ATP-dependent HslUV protease, peptidase subunit HslV